MSKGFALALAVLSVAAISGCGAPDEMSAQDDSEIIGGTTDTGDPAVLALFAHKPGAQSGSLCTASLVSPTVLLHAAHCVDPREVGFTRCGVARDPGSVPSHL